MSAADLIQRLREFAKATVETVTAENGARLTYEDSIVWLAADTLAAKDAALSEMEREHSASRQNFHTMQHAANALRQRAFATEAELALARKALEPFAKVLAAFPWLTKQNDAEYLIGDVTLGDFRNAARALGPAK